MQIKLSELKAWEVLGSEHKGYCVAEKGGHLLCSNLTLSEAMMVAAAPALLKFLAPIAQREGSPLFVDLSTLLGKLGLEIVA